MEELLKQLVEGQKQLFEGQKQIMGRLDGVEGRLGNVEGHLSKVEGRLENVEGQCKENTDYIKTFLHWTEELDAKFDGILAKTATKEAVQRIEAKVDILTHRIMAQDGEIQLLKQAR